MDFNRRRRGRCRLSFVPRDQPYRYLLARAVPAMEVVDCGLAKDPRYLPVGRQAVVPIPGLNGLRQPIAPSKPAIASLPTTAGIAAHSAKDIRSFHR